MKTPFRHRDGENYAKLNSINLDGKTPLDIFCDNKEYWGNRYLLYKSDLEDLGYKTRDFLDSYYSEIYKVILEQGMALPKRFVVEDIISFCDSNGNNLLHILFQHSKKIQHDVVDKALFLMNCRVSRILTPSAINNSKHFDPSEFQAF